MRRIIFIALVCLTACKERLTLHYTVRNETHIVAFEALPEWQTDWSSRIVHELEEGSFPGYNEENEILSPDSIKLGRELTRYSRWGDAFPEISQFDPDRLVGEWQLERPDYLTLMFFNSETGFYQFYSRVRVHDLEDLVDRDLDFAEAEVQRYFEI